MANPVTAVYFSPKFITVARAAYNKKTKKMTVIKKADVDMPEGAVINGVISDEDSLFAAFSKLARGFGKIKNAVLVMDTTHVVNRLSMLPVVSAKEMQTLVRNEFVNRNMADIDYLYDYAIVPAPQADKKQRLVLSCAVDKNIVDTYRAFFKKAGVTLSAVDFSANAALQAFANGGNPWTGKNTVFCIIDYYIVVIFNCLANGEVSFSRSRILSTEVEDNYFTEINNVLFSYLQGRKAINRNEDTHTLCVLDNNSPLPEDEYRQKLSTLGFENVYVGINNMFPVRGIPARDADRYAYGLFAAAAETRKNLNFLTVKLRKAMARGRRRGVTAAVAGAVVVAAAAGSLFYLDYETDKLQAQIDGYEAYMLNADVRAAVNLYQASVNEIALLNETISRLGDYETVVGSTAIMKRDIVDAALYALRQADANADITRIAFNSRGRQLSIDCFSVQALMVSEFVESLRGTGIFADIVYSRYASVGRLDNADGYTFNIECYVKEVKPIE